MTCPKCQSTERQNKAGSTKAGSQRYRCMACGSKYTPKPRQQGYDEEFRLEVVKMYVDGLNLRRVSEHKLGGTLARSLSGNGGVPTVRLNRTIARALELGHSVTIDGAVIE